MTISTTITRNEKCSRTTINNHRVDMVARAHPNAAMLNHNHEMGYINSDYTQLLYSVCISNKTSQSVWQQNLMCSIVIISRKVSQCKQSLSWSVYISFVRWFLVVIKVEEKNVREQQCQKFTWDPQCIHFSILLHNGDRVALISLTFVCKQLCL